MTNSSDEPAGLDFLDFLFTVAISVGLTPEVLQIPGVSGFLSEEWQKSGRWPSTDEFFEYRCLFVRLLQSYAKLVRVPRINKDKTT